MRDYIYFCFEGEVKAMFVVTNRQNRPEHCFDFFDNDYNHLDIVNRHLLTTVIPDKSQSIDKKEIATKLRVDFYEVDWQPYVGELTLFHHGGWMRFESESWIGYFVSGLNCH